MKISINCNDNLKVFDSPPSVYFVGATIICKGKKFVALDSYNDSPLKQDEEIIFDEKLKVILHYYSNPALEEILTEVSGYEGPGFIEIKTEVFQISVCI